MLRYLARRLVSSLVLLALVSVIIFVVLRAIPGDPSSLFASQLNTTPTQLEHLRAELGLNKSLFQQYVAWITGALHGNFGRTYFNPAFSTTTLIKERIGPTIELAIAALLLALIVAVPAALLCALRPFSAIDRVVVALASAAVAIPAFWLGLLMISLFAVHLGWFPTRGYTSFTQHPLANLRLLLLPASTMAIVLAGPIIRILRASLLDTTSADFVRTARGKGLIWRRVVFHHAFPNALLPTLTVVGLLVGNMLGGIVIIEDVFGWPGLGSLTIDAVERRDYAVLQAILLLSAALFLVVTLVVDVIVFRVDPRTRTAE